MSLLSIEVTPELERRLKAEARRRGQSVEGAAFAILEETLTAAEGAPAIPSQVATLFEGLPRRKPNDLLALAEAQGVKPVARFEDLLGDFWPDDETCDQFITWLRDSRRDRSVQHAP